MRTAHGKIILSFMMAVFAAKASAQHIKIDDFTIREGQVQPFPNNAGTDAFWDLARSGAPWITTTLPHTSDLALLVIPEKAGNKSHVFELQFNYRRNGVFDNLGVKELFTFTSEDINLQRNALKDFDFTQIKALCDLINAGSGLAFQLIPIVGDEARPPDASYFDGVIIQRIPCSQSSYLKINDRPSLPTGPYKEDRIKCVPTGFNGTLLTEVKANGDTSWFKSATKKEDPKKAGAKPKSGKPVARDTLTSTTFPYTCDDKHDFRVALFKDKKGNIQYITIFNRMDKQELQLKQVIPVKPASVEIMGYEINLSGKASVDSLFLSREDPDSTNLTDTLLTLALSEAQARYILKPAGSLDSLVIRSHTDKSGKTDSFFFSLYTIPLFRYPYDVLFNAGSFERFLKSHYRDIGDLCAGDVSNAVHEHDPAFMQYAFGTVPSTTTKKDSSVSVIPWIKPGVVSIPRTAPFIMTPGTVKRYIRVPLQLSGKYDTAACVVPFKVRFGSNLANHFVLVDSATLISEKSWDSAMDLHGGRLNVDLAFQADSTVDSLSRTQEAYLAINDSLLRPANKIGGLTYQSGYLPVELRNSNPGTTFWLELGTNFELLNGLKPQNIYSGIILFDKDIATWSMWGTNHYISLIGGAYESLTSSTFASADSGIYYRDNTSYTANAANQYPVYHDTGYVSVTSNTKNIGLIFEPALSLTTTPNKQNGLHISVALYNELLWSTVTTSNDYSKLARDSSVTKYVSADTLYKYHFKQSTAVSEDYRTSYLGIGFPIYLKRNAFTFFFNPVFGWTNQKFTPIRPQADYGQVSKVYKYPLDSISSGYPYPYLQPRCSWNPFYIAQFRFNEEKYDITVTGDIRFLVLRNSSPLVTLSISKKFDLSRLVKGVSSLLTSNASNSSN